MLTHAHTTGLPHVMFLLLTGAVGFLVLFLTL